MKVKVKEIKKGKEKEKKEENGKEIKKNGKVDIST